MPALLRVMFADGTHRDYRLPVESWIRETTTAVLIEPDKTVVRAVVDPDHRLPDRDRSNNSMDVRP